MANFKIKVEPLNKDVEVPEKLLNGLECDGYFMVGHTDQGEGSSKDTISINQVTTIDMAISIAKSTDLLKAAIIAHGMEKATVMTKNREKAKAPDLLAALMRARDD